MPRHQQRALASSTSVHELPDNWYPQVLQFVIGFENTTISDFSAPIIKPALVHTYAAFVAQYVLLAVTAIGGNVAVLAHIGRYRLYRDVTHAFLSNLAVAHLVQVCLVMPMTVMVIIIQNWIYGQFMCFFTPLLQVSAFVRYGWIWTGGFRCCRIQ